MRRALVVLVLLSGCWTYLEPGEGFDPIAPSEELPLWTEQVTRAATAWNVALGDDCQPFHVTPGSGMRVELIALDDWPDREDHPRTVGWYDYTGYIMVRADQDSRSRHFTLLHEIGHAVGLDEHSEDEADVMHSPASYNISANDVRRMRDVLGCNMEDGL